MLFRSKIIGEGATNIIPDEVFIEGTFRTMDEKWRSEAHQIMQSMAEKVASSLGGECIFDIKKGYPFLVNDHQATAISKRAAIEYIGENNVVDLGLRMTAEDFAYFSQAAPSCFYRLGVKNEEKGISSNLHTSTFDIDEDALKLSIGYMAYNTIKQLEDLK